jgi:flagellar hook-associated protein 2
MSISFLGTGSGLPVSEWITALVSSANQPITKLQSKETEVEASKTELSTVKSKYSSLQSSVDTFTDSNIVSAFDIFENKSASSSNEDYATVTASNNAVIGDYALKIDQLATATVSKSNNSPGASANASTLINQLANYTGKVGTFTMYLNGEAHTFQMCDEDDTVDDGVTKITDNTIGGVVGAINTTLSSKGVTASLGSDGKFNITTDSGAVSSISLGSNSDTSNLFTVLQVGTSASATTAMDGSVTYASQKALSSINIHGSLTDNDANLNSTVKAGTFTIGDATFTIDDTTTLKSLINTINSSEDANVTATYDATSNKLVVTSDDKGAKNVKIISGTSNFTDVMGLTSTTWDGDGKVINSTLATGSQTLGNNAKFSINGENYEAATNKITSDITGLTGVTINLLKTTYADSSDGETEINVGVTQNTDSIVTAMNSFISAYNSLLLEVDSATSVGKSLHSENTLERMISSLKSTTTGAVSGIDRDSYNSLAMIGVTTGKIGSTANMNGSLTLDKDDFLESLSKNPSLVKSLLIGDGSSDYGNITGIMTNLKDQLDAALDATDGYFVSKNDTYDAEMSDIEDSISKKTEQLKVYQSRLTQQFSQMDTYISQLKSSSSCL